MADDRVVIAARSLIRVVRVPLHTAICGAEHNPRMTHPSSYPTTAQAIIDGNSSRAICFCLVTAQHATPKYQAAHKALRLIALQISERWKMCLQALCFLIAITSSPTRFRIRK